MRSRSGLILLSLFLISLLTATAGAERNRAARGWKKLGSVKGLLGDDWYSKTLRTAQVYATGEDLPYLVDVVKGLDASYEANARFMGFRARGKLKFYFFPMTKPAHRHPKWRSRIGGMSKFAGLAMSGTDTCLVNMGNQQQASPYAPVEIEATVRHEMNHLFAYQRIQRGEWSWFLEAIAENIEQTVLPKRAQMGAQDYRRYLKGYTSKDASWAALTAERNNNNVESYRDFGKILSSIVAFMTDKYGSQAVAKIMKVAPGRTPEQAIKKALGKSIPELEKEWKKYYGIR